jgi:hypothetical protein
MRVEIFWNNALNEPRITDQREFPREEHPPESHRKHGFIIPEGYEPLAGGEAVGRHPRKTEGNEPTQEGVAVPSIKTPRVVFNTFCYPCWHPSGVQSLSRSYPGGIARCRELNHRLMALNPPGSLLTVVPKNLHLLSAPHFDYADPEDPPG